MAKNALFNFLNGYEVTDAVNGRSVTGKSFFLRSYSGKMKKTRRRTLPVRFFGALKSGARSLAFTPAKSYGAFALTLGLLSLIFNFVKDYLPYGAPSSTSALIIGAVFAVAAVPFLLSDKPLGLLLEGFSVTNYVFFEFFCIKRPYKTGADRACPVWLLIVLGTACAVVGVFLPLWAVALAVLGFIFLLVSFLSPEFAFFSSLLLLPYYGAIPHSAIVFSLIIGISVISFVRKAVAGKRVIFFEQYDLVIAIMLVAVMASGIFISGVDSFVSGLLLFVMSFGYFLSSNVVTNRRLADCAVGAVAVSSVPAAAVAVMQVLYRAYTTASPAALFEGTASMFSSPAALAVYLIAGIIFSAVLAKQNSGRARLGYNLIAALDAVALIFSGEILAVAALVIGVFAYAALKARAWSALILPILFFIPYVFLLIPQSLLDLLPERIGLSGISELWRAVISAVRENPFGVGIGEDSFSSAMAEYGIFNVRDAGNLFMEFALEAGVVALFALLVLFVIRLRHRARYYGYVKSSQLATLAPAIAVGSFSLLCYGATEYIWADASVFYLFWCIFGLGSATLRVAKKEHDDRVLYFEDTRRTYSSSIGVRIK